MNSVSLKRNFGARKSLIIFFLKNSSMPNKLDELAGIAYTESQFDICSTDDMH